MSLTFESGDIPPGDPGDDDAAGTDLTCTVCGVTFPYAGRGRKSLYCPEHRVNAPKQTRTSSARSGGQVEAALMILEGIYNGLAAALMLTAPGAAMEWSMRIAGLQQANRVALTADPDLTTRILALGRGSGKFSFFAAHVIAVAPVVTVARAELKARALARPPKPPKTPKAGPAPFEPEMPFMGKPPPSDFFT